MPRHQFLRGRSQAALCLTGPLYNSVRMTMLESCHHRSTATTFYFSFDQSISLSRYYLILRMHASCFWVKERNSSMCASTRTWIWARAHGILSSSWNLNCREATQVRILAGPWYLATESLVINCIDEYTVPYIYRRYRSVMRWLQCELYTVNILPTLPFHHRARLGSSPIEEPENLSSMWGGFSARGTSIPCSLY
jgi:hypothetical protein